MGIKKTPRAFIDILDAEGKITHHEVEFWVTYETDDPNDEMAKVFSPKIVREEVTPDDMAKLRGTSDNALTSDNRKLNDQIGQMQEAHKAECDGLKEELVAVNQQVDTLQKENAKQAGLIASVRSVLG